MAWPGLCAASGRYAFLGGGAGEPAEENFLVKDLRDLRKTLAARGWDVRVAAGPKDATDSKLLAGIRETLAAARPGDEALILLHSHGSEREAASGQRSHSVAAADSDLDLDRIEPVLAAASARGVKVALVDLSCYSGATQALKGASCTASLAAADYISFCSGRAEEREFNSRFFKLPPPGEAIDLETQFLKARRLDRDSTNLPELSTLAYPAGLGWDDFLAEVDPLDVYGDIQDLRAGTKPFDPDRLLSRLPASSREAVAGRLKRILETRARMEGLLPGLAKDYDEQTLTLELPGRDPLPLSLGALSDDLDRLSDRKTDGYTDAHRSLLAALADTAPAVKIRYDQELRDFRSRRDELDRLADELARSAGELMGLERVLYDASVRPPARDACRDFQL